MRRDVSNESWGRPSFEEEKDKQQEKSMSVALKSRLGSCSDDYNSSNSKCVTFKVKNRASLRGRSRTVENHRRTRSDPLQPLSHTKLLSEEINQLQKKKQKLENGTEPLHGWNDKEIKKLQEVIDLILDEKRKEQLGQLKRRAHRREQDGAEEDLEKKRDEAGAGAPNPEAPASSDVLPSLEKSETTAAAAVAAAAAAGASDGCPIAKETTARIWRPMRRAKSANARQQVHSSSSSSFSSSKPSRPGTIFDPRFWTSPPPGESPSMPTADETGHEKPPRQVPPTGAARPNRNKGSGAKAGLWTSSEEGLSAPKSSKKRVVRCLTISSTEFKHILKEGTPPNAKPLKKRPSWEKFFPIQKSKVVKGKSPRENSAVRELEPRERNPSSVGKEGNCPATVLNTTGEFALPSCSPVLADSGEHPLPGGVSPRLQERCAFLDKWLKGRPTWKDVFERGLFTTKAKLKSKISSSPCVITPEQTNGNSASDKERSGAKGEDHQHSKAGAACGQRGFLYAWIEKEAAAPSKGDLKERMRSSTDALERLLQERPSWFELMERGIGKDENRDEKKREKCKRTLRYLLRKRKEKEVQTQKGAGVVDTYFEIGRPQRTAEDCHVICTDRMRDDGSEVPHREINFFNLDFVGPIGGGCYGNVYEAYLKGETEKVAVKILRKDLYHPEKAFKREVEALKRTAKSPHIVKLRGYCTDPYYCIVTELCAGGSLDKALLRKPHPAKLTLNQAVRIAREVAEGMKFLHSLKPPIMHRDLSINNIFLHPSIEGRVCVGDFGLAVDKIKRGSVQFSKNGNPRYRAPEVSNGEPYSRKAEVYSFGNLFFELLTSEKPFPDVEDNKVAELIAKGCTPRFSESSAVPERLRRLVERCWRKNPSDRPSFKKVVATLTDYWNEQHASKAFSD